MTTVPESGSPTTGTRSSATGSTIASRPRRTLPSALETVGDSEEESLLSSTEKKTEISTTTASQTDLRSELAVSKELNRKLQMEIDRLSKNNGVRSTPSASSDAELKKKLVVLTKRAQSAEQARDSLTEKFKDYEQEKLETSKILEMADLAYQNIQSQCTSLTKELEIYKQNSKSTNSAASAESSIAIRKLQDQNTDLETRIKEITAELEKEKSDQAIVVAELKAKVILLETSAKNSEKMDINQRLSNLPQHPKKEMADARAEIVAKDKKIAQLEASLEEIHGKSALLADQLNRMCDEVEKGEKVVARMEIITKENQTLKHENANLTTDLETLKEELQQKEKEILTVLDDNDKMVAKLITLGYQVQVEDDSALTFTEIAIPSKDGKKPIPAKVQDKKDTSNNFKIIQEDLSGLSIDELLNG
jgi:chromosome segregation ATPase